MILCENKNVCSTLIPNVVKFANCIYKAIDKKCKATCRTMDAGCGCHTDTGSATQGMRKYSNREIKCLTIYSLQSVYTTLVIRQYTEHALQKHKHANNRCYQSEWDQGWRVGIGLLKIGQGTIFSTRFAAFALVILNVGAPSQPIRSVCDNQSAPDS